MGGNLGNLGRIGAYRAAGSALRVRLNLRSMIFKQKRLFPEFKLSRHDECMVWYHCTKRALHWLHDFVPSISVGAHSLFDALWIDHWTWTDFGWTHIAACHRKGRLTGRVNDRLDCRYG